MPIFRPNRAKGDLARYWDALDRNAPAEELAQLAGHVHPDHIAAISRARALHRRRRPDPAFATRLENNLMDAFASSGDEITPPPLIQFPAGRAAGPSVEPSRPRAGWLPRLEGRLLPALEIGLVILLVLASIAGIWLANDRDNNSHVVVPPVATPEAEASPDVPMYRGNPERTGVFPGPGIEGDPVQLWRLDLDGPIDSAPAVVDGILYVGVGDGTVQARDVATGEEIWTYTAASPVASSPAVIDGVVYIGSDDGTLYALDAGNGSEVWTFPGAAPNVSVVVANGVVYTGSADGVVHALNAASGADLWQAPLGGAVSRSPSVADGVVYIGSDDGILHTFDAVTGEPGWTFQTEGGGLVATTAIANGLVYQTTREGVENSYAYALAAATGEVVWRFAQEFNAGFLPPAAGDDLIYIPSHDNALYAVDAMTGQEVWSFATGGPVSASPVLVGDTLYVAPRDGFVYALDAVSGSELWRFPVEGETVFGPTVIGGVAYAGTTFGYLYAIGGTGETTLAFPESGDASEAAAQATPSGVATPAATPAIAGELATFLWETTGGDVPFAQPTDITIAPDGTIWVANGEHSQFEIFAPDGTFLEAWGTPGSGDGEFNFIRPNSGGDAFGAVAFTPDGSFYVTDTGNRRVQHFSADRQFLHAWGEAGRGDGQFFAPVNVAVDSQGNVFVIDYLRNDIQKFAPDGAFLLKFGGSGSEPGRLDEPNVLRVDRNDTIWVGDYGNGRVQQFDNDGQFLNAYDAGGELAGPVGVTVDAEGRIFVADWDGQRVVVLDSAGAVIGTWDEGGQQPLGELYDVEVDNEGRVYLVDFSANRLVAYQVDLPLVDEPIATPVS